MNCSKQVSMCRIEKISVLENKMPSDPNLTSNSTISKHCYGKLEILWKLQQFSRYFADVHNLDIVLGRVECVEIELRHAIIVFCLHWRILRRMVISLSMRRFGPRNSSRTHLCDCLIVFVNGGRHDCFGRNAAPSAAPEKVSSEALFTSGELVATTLGSATPYPNPE